MFDVGWGDSNKHIMVWQARKHWSAEQMGDALREGFALASLTSNQVIGLIDVRHTEATPLEVIHTTMTIAHHSPPNLKMLVFIGEPQMWRGISQSLGHVFRPRGVSVHMTASTQEAYRIAQDYLADAWV